MPTSQELDKVKENLADIITFISSINLQGKNIILNSSVSNNFQAAINLYTNALKSVNNPVSNYVAASIGGYALLTPSSLLVTFNNIQDAFDAIYSQSINELNNFQINTESFWFNMCIGVIYTPNGFSTLSVTLNELVSAQFFKETDAIYAEKLNAALVALDESLKFSLK